MPGRRRRRRVLKQRLLLIRSTWRPVVLLFLDSFLLRFDSLLLRFLGFADAAFPDRFLDDPGLERRLQLAKKFLLFVLDSPLFFLQLPKLLPTLRAPLLCGFGTSLLIE